MGALTGAAKQQYKKGNPTAHLVLELDLPGGTVRWGRESMISSLGRIDGRIRSFGEWPMGEATRGTIAEQQAQVLVEDEDGFLRNLLAGSTANSVYRAEVRLKLVPRAPLTSADTHKLATGIIRDIYPSGRRSYNIVIGPNDYALVSDFPEATLSAAQWPLAPADNWGQSYPQVYGAQTSPAGVGGGQIPLICVDTSAAPNARWLICIGRAKTVSNVYINGTAAGGGTWAHQFVARGGLGFSTIVFSSAAPAVTDTVTVNMDGYETVGDGSGTVIQDPVACIRHLLNNFILGRWRAGSGNWLGDHSMLSTDSFNTASVFTTAHAAWFTSKRYSGPQRKGTDALTEWLESYGFGAYWTRDGKLGIVPIDSPIVPAVYPVDTLELDTDTAEAQFGAGLSSYLTRVSAQFAYSESQGQYLRSLEVRNPRLADTIEEATQFPWSGTVDDFDQTRQILSRELLSRMNAQENLDFTAPLWLVDLDVDVNAYVGLVDPSGLEAEWGRKKWQRRLHRIQKQSILGDTMQVRLSTRGLRKIALNLWETMQPGKSATILKQYGDSLALLTNGQTRSYARTGSGWVVDAGDGRIVAVGANENMYDRAGHLIERAATNYVLRSSFVSALTGWTVANTTADTADLFFDSAVSANSAKMLSTGVAHATMQHTTAAAAQVVRLSIDYKNDTAASAISFTFTRSSDGRFWRESDSTWQVGATNNTLPIVTTKNPDARFVSKVIDFGAAGLTGTLIITTTAFSQTAHVYHFQVDSNAWAGSRIVTDSATVTRNAATFTYTNNSSGRIVSMERGTIHFGGFIPSWSGTDSAISHVVFLIDHGANDRARLLWDGPNARWALEVVRAGVTVSALYAVSPVRGTAYDIGVRWISSEGELDLAPFRWSLHFNGVEVASVTAGGTVTEAATADFDILHSAGTGPGDASYRHLLISPFAFSDAEIARLPL